MISKYLNGTIEYFENQKPFYPVPIVRAEEWSDADCNYIKTEDSLQANCINGSEIIYPYKYNVYGYYGYY